jgi:hypothetical protein
MHHWIASLPMNSKNVIDCIIGYHGYVFIAIFIANESWSIANSLAMEFGQ